MSRAKKIAVGVAAGAAALLTSTIALAGGPNTLLFLAHKDLVGWLAIAAGLIYTGRLLWRELKPENYQSPQSQLNVGSPTPKKLFKTLVAPAWASLMAVGTAMKFAPVLDAIVTPLASQYLGISLPHIALPVFGLPVAVSWTACALIITVAAAKTTIGSALDLYRAYRLKYKFVGRDIHQSKLVSNLLTNVSRNGAWAALTIFTAHLAEIYATQTLALARNYLHNLIFGQQPLVMLAWGAAFGAFALGRYLLVGRRKANMDRQLQTLDQTQMAKIWNTVKVVGAAAAIGATVFLAGPALTAGNLFVFAVVLGFTHNFIHSNQSQKTGLHQKDKVRPVFDLKSLWENVRSVAGAVRTVFKPGVDMVDPLVSSYIMVLLTQGAHWVLNAVSGCYSAADYKKAVQMILKLLNPEAQRMRNILKSGYADLKKATTPAEARDALAAALEETARFMDRSANGDLKSRSGLAFLKDGMFCTGLPIDRGIFQGLFNQETDNLWQALVDARYVNKDRVPLDGKKKGIKLTDTMVKALFESLTELEKLSELKQPSDDEKKILAEKRNDEYLMSVFEFYKTAKGLEAKKAADKKTDPQEWGKNIALAGVELITNRFQARGDQDLRVHGEHIRFAAREYEETARLVRRMDVSRVDLDSLKQKFARRLNALYCRAYTHADTTPVRFYTNILPDGYNAKQFAIDFCQQVMADFVGGFDLAVLSPNGQVKLWLVPMKVVKDFKKDYREVMAIESRDTEGEDLRLGWYKRDDHDIVNTTLSDIHHIDNTAHFDKHGHDIKKYPTAEVLTPPKLENDEFYDVVYRDGARLRIFGDGHQEVVAGNLDGKTPLLILPGTERHQYVAANTTAVFDESMIDTGLLATIKSGDIPHPWGGSLVKDADIAPRWRFMYPTEYTSVSDADQMDINVTNLRLFHTRALPHLRIMYRRPRKENVPYSEAMVDSPHDSLLEVGVANVWMVLKAKLTGGRELYFPLNMNKENERTFGGDLWKYIDETKPLEIVKKATGYFLKITPREAAFKDPDFVAATEIEINDRGTYQVMKNGEYNKRDSILEVPLPLEMVDLAAKNMFEAGSIHIDPIRYGDVGGPVPVMDYIFLRHNEAGDVTDKARERVLPRRLAQLIINGTYSLLSETEMEHVETVDDVLNREDLPYTDKKGLVHLAMTEEEYQAFKPWITPYHGQRGAQWNPKGEVTMEAAHFNAMCEAIYDQISYRRFMPDDRCRTFWDPAEVS
ncbi:MAG: hypothetical protein WC632_02215 [Candidatus Margulisiibacteriota bacterium]